MFNLPFFLGLFPLVVLVVLIINVKMPVYKAVLITLALVLGITYFAFDTPASDLANAVGYGILKGLWPIVIVIFGAIFAYNLMRVRLASSVINSPASLTTAVFSFFSLPGALVPSWKLLLVSRPLWLFRSGF